MSTQPAPEPAGPPEHPPDPEPAPARHRGRRFPFRESLPAIGIILGVFAVAGVVAGILWSRLGLPDGPIEAVMYNGAPLFENEVTASRLFAMDGWFALLGAIGGVLLGTVLYPSFRRHGPWTVGALVLGGFLAAATSFAVGTLVANDQVILAWEPTAEQGARIVAPLTLQAYGVAVAWPASALVSVLILAWLWQPGARPESGADSVVHTPEDPDAHAGGGVR